MASAPLSDSGESTGNRSADNATPPMHFLTPHVEISIPYPEQTAQRNPSPAINGDGPNSPQSADSNSNAPSSSHHQLTINSTAIHRLILQLQFISLMTESRKNCCFLFKFSLRKSFMSQRIIIRSQWIRKREKKKFSIRLRKVLLVINRIKF